MAGPVDTTVSKFRNRATAPLALSSARPSSSGSITSISRARVSHEDRIQTRLGGWETTSPSRLPLAHLETTDTKQYRATHLEA